MTDPLTSLLQEMADKAEAAENASDDEYVQAGFAFAKASPPAVVKALVEVAKCTKIVVPSTEGRTGTVLSARNDIATAIEALEEE